MTHAGTRIEQVTGSLTPKQAVAHWLAEAETAQHLAAYYEMLSSPVASDYPLVQLLTQVTQATRTAMTRRPHEEVQRAVKRQAQDVAYLYFLIEQTNDRLLQSRQASWLHLALLSEMVFPMIHGQARPGVAEEWRRRAQAQVVRVRGQQRAAQILATRYYGGQLPLFEEVAADLHHQVESTLSMVAIFNESLEIESLEIWTPTPTPHRRRTKPVPSEPPLDVTTLEPAVAQYGDNLAAYLTDLAKAEALRLVGDPDSARSYLARHLVGVEA
jgi:hypothetical protein